MITCPSAVVAASDWPSGDQARSVNSAEGSSTRNRDSPSESSTSKRTRAAAARRGVDFVGS